MACLIGIAGLLAWFAQTAPALASSTPLLVIGGLVYVVLIGFAVAAICGYMAGLIGSSNSPVSGVGILAIIIASLLMLGVMAIAGVPADPSIIAFALIVTAVVFSVAVIANDNLQDLKTGQLVEATPWRQQTALIVGVAAGALVIPFILNLLNQAFGFEGGPAAIVEGTKTLAAPQATLISALARGVIGGDLRWDLIGLGAAIGLVIIVLDAVLEKATNKKIKLPPLAVGIGFYLPAAVTTMLVIGAVCGWLYDRASRSTRYADVARRMGVLLASGLIVGESLFGVLTAGVIVSGHTDTVPWDGQAWTMDPLSALVKDGNLYGRGSADMKAFIGIAVSQAEQFLNSDAPFAMLPADTVWPAMLAGVIGFFVLTFGLYRWAITRAAKV